MKLTHDNYHTLENRNLTNSRIGDWLKDPLFFYEKHVTGQRINKSTDAMKIGSAVDTFIFEGEEVFRSKFVAVARRSIKNPPINVTELTESQYEDCVTMAKILIEQPAFKDLADHKTQQILSLKTDIPIGEHFVGLAGIPDWVKFDGDTCYLTDLKTAVDATEGKYYWKCVGFGYFRQFAVQTIIIRKTHPEIKNFVYRHLVIEKDQNNSIFLPYTFYLANEKVEEQVDLLIDSIIPAIASEKEFKSKQATWKDAPTIGVVNEDF